METPNGNGSWFQWLARACVGLGFALGGWAGNQIIVTSRDVAMLKEANSSTHDSVFRIERDLERLNTKIDRVLEKK